MTRASNRVLWTLQATVLLLPLFLGGQNGFGLTAAWLVMAALLVLTLRERRRAGQPALPGAGFLAAFVAVMLFTTVPLPPAWIATLAPATADLYREMLPGWPGGGGWRVWRPLAIDVWAVWSQLGALAVGFAAYLVLAGWPWGDDAARARAFGRMALTMLAGGLGLALLAMLQEVAGNGQVMWITDVEVNRGRASGPFDNPNHLATWLEMTIPLGLAYTWSLGRRLWRRIVKAAESGQRLGVRRRRAWAGALIANQRRLILPFAAAAAVALMATAHAWTQSRGGTAALLAGAGVTVGGVLASTARRRRGTRAGRWLPAAAALALVLGGAAAMGLWLRADDLELAAVEQVEPSLSARLAVAVQSTGIVRDNPLFGTGLGTWQHAFRPYAEPPSEGSIWDHAHNDYVELAADTGVLGVALAFGFALAVALAVRRARRRAALADARRERRASAFGERPDWRAALEGHHMLGWGLAGGVTAVLVHAVVEHGLHMPANFLLLMVTVGLLVLALPMPEARRAWGFAACAGLLLAAALPLGWNAAATASGGIPLSPDEALEIADLAVAEGEEGGHERALALVTAAVERAPANLYAHEMLASVLGPGPAGEEALRRLLAREPWYLPARDVLAFRLWERGEREAAATELEESFWRYPYLRLHSFLRPEINPSAGDGEFVVRALAEGDTAAVRVSRLDPVLGAAIARGLERAVDEFRPGLRRPDIVADRVALLEADGRWAEAADMLRAEAERDQFDARSLSQAARNYLKAGDPERAEQALIAALQRNPERGTLYQRLAVDIYSARGDFASAERVLQAGERHAVDMLPVYTASTEVIQRREQAWAQRMSGRDTGRGDAAP